VLKGLAARLERIAARLNREVVSSAAFARQCEDNWADLGEFPEGLPAGSDE
jgi:hypothetical protein